MMNCQQQELILLAVYEQYSDKLLTCCLQKGMICMILGSLDNRKV